MIGTFVIPAYNREDTIDRAIRSVAQQGLSGYEIIVVDDASTDNTLKVAREWSNRYPKNIIVLPFKDHLERVIALNSGIRYARGEWVIPFDSDDEVSSHFIKALEDAKNRHPRARVFNWSTVFHSKQDGLYHRSEVLPVFNPPIDDEGKIGAFRAGGITSGGYAFQKKLIFEKGYLPGASNCYTFGERFLKWHPEVKPLYEPGKTDIGNPWGQDYALFYQVTRGLHNYEVQQLDQILNIHHGNR